jgi:hypothetical protein
MKDRKTIDSERKVGMKQCQPVENETIYPLEMRLIFDIVS